MMVQLFMLAFAIIGAYIYRCGIKDGQTLASGGKIVDKPVKLFKGKTDNDNDRLRDAMRARAEFKGGVDK